MRKINPELWLLLFLVVIAAVLNFLAASQRMALVFYFLPVMYSAYRLGRRHATLTAFASVVLVVLLTYFNPALTERKVDLPFDSRWFDYTVWGGILMIAGYAMGTLYERNQKSLLDMKSGYEGMLVILQQFIANQKHSDTHAYRVSLYATKIAESMGLEADVAEDVSTAALLRNANELGVTNDVLCKAANLSAEDLQKGTVKGFRGNGSNLANALRRAILIFVAEQELAKTGSGALQAPVQVQILAVADAYESLLSRKEKKTSPAEAEEIIVKSSGKKYDAKVVTAFVDAFGGQARGTGAGK